MRLHRTLLTLAACLTLGAVGTAAPSQASPPSRHHDRAQLIAFTAAVGDYEQIFTIGSDGGNLRQITHDDANHRNPDWSPDGRLLTFEADDGISTSWLVLAHADGSHLTRLPTLGVQVEQPSFSPDGRLLYFGRYNGTREAIYSVNLNGANLKRITDPPAGHGDTDPNVSPDGHTLSFVRLSDGTEDGPAALFKTDFAIGREKQLTSYATNVAVKQDWSPNSRQIAFTQNGYDRPPGGNSNVVVTKRSGNSRQAITHYTDGTTQAIFGSYSPDGRWIVIRLEQGDLRSLVKIRSDGSQPVTLMSIPGFSPRYIAWGPHVVDTSRDADLLDDSGSGATLR